MRSALSMVIATSVILYGCAQDNARQPVDDEFARMSDTERMQWCARVYRDVRIFCRTGLHDESASRSFECLTARMKLDRHCLRAP